MLEAGEEWVQVYVPKYGIEKRACHSRVVLQRRIVLPFQCLTRGRHVAVQGFTSMMTQECRARGSIRTQRQ